MPINIQLYKQSYDTYYNPLTINRYKMHPNSQVKPTPNTHPSFNSTVQSNTFKPIHTQLLSTSEQIKSALTTHTYLIHDLLQNDHQSQPFLPSTKKYQIANHCNQYSKASPFIVNILNGKIGTSLHFQQQNFWQVNEGLERQLQTNLKDLKIIDNIIDNIINQQFDKCNEIDEIEQTIRTILSRRDSGHIAKAEPYFQKKQHCLTYLEDKKQEKERIKSKKLWMIKKIISLLDQLKRHRQTGLKVCQSDQTEHKALQTQHTLIDRIAADIRQIQKKQLKLLNFDLQFKDLYLIINNTQSKIDKSTKQLFGLLDQQNQTAVKLEELIRLKSETQYFQSSIFAVFGVSNIRRYPKSDYIRQIQSILSKLDKYLKQAHQKQTQLSKIQHSVETTKKTISIFDNIMVKIQTESLRKNQLLRDIEKIQQKYMQQDRTLAAIADGENQLEKIKLRKNLLNRNLENKLNQANLTAYKSIHDELMKIQDEISTKAKQTQYNRQTMSENARQLYDDTMKIQQNYQDILSQVIPSIWIKGNDFDKEETIKDLNLYLLKIFKRLSIAD